MERETYQIQGMDCPDCALNIEKGVRRLAGVRSADVDFASGRMVVESSANFTAIRGRVEALGYRLEPTSSQRGARGKERVALSFVRYMSTRPETRLALLGGALIGLAYITQLLGVSRPVFLAIQIAALLLAGYPVARSALANLIINRDININLLMTIAAVGAVVIGDISEGALLIFLFAIAEALEGFTLQRTRKVLSELTELAPARAIRLTDGGEESVALEALVPGDLILIRAGERIPMDGLVTEGFSEVNQAPITGESLPMMKETGAEVFSGTINGSGTLTVRITRRVNDTTLSRIIQMVEEAHSVRAPSQRLIDRFARVYTPVMILAAAMVALVPPLLFNQPFFNPAGGERGWLYRALALLVVACPCALVISAPVTILSAIAAAARRGVLIKGGVYLEALSRVKVFAFDKTGTLTEGKPVLTLYRSVDCTGEESCRPCDEVLGLAYALEQRSAHPLATAVVDAAEANGVARAYTPAERVVTLAGLGLRGQVGGRQATIGSQAFFEREYPPQIELNRWQQAAEKAGQTTMMVWDDEQVRGLIAVSDPVRTHSGQVIAELHALGVKTALLTGDNPTVAAAVASQTGIDFIKAGLLPEQKVDAILNLRARYGEVAMVGDGINDTPALAAASVGITLGGAGSAQALETAGVVLMADNLCQLPVAVRLSAFARRLIYANIGISLLTKLVFTMMALFGVTTMWMAVAADMGVSLLVTLNGLRPLRFRG